MKKPLLSTLALGALSLFTIDTANAVTWNNSIRTGTAAWSTAGNWGTGGVPNGTDAIAQIELHGTNATTGTGLTISLSQNVTVGQLLIRWGASAASQGPAISVGEANTPHTITLKAAGSQAILQHNSGSHDHIRAKVVVDSNASFQTASTYTNNTYHGILNLEGGLKINDNFIVAKSSGDGEYRINGLEMGKFSSLNKTNGNLYISGNRNLISGELITTVSTTRFFNRSDDQSLQSHTTFLVPGGVQNVNRGIYVTNGALWLGGGVTHIAGQTAPTTASWGTSNFYISSRIEQTGGEMNIGDSVANETPWKVTANATFYANNFIKGAGTMRLQYGNGHGVTTILGGTSVNGIATYTNATSAGLSQEFGTVTAGMRVYGEGIAKNTFVSSVSGNNIVLSNNTVLQAGEAVAGKSLGVMFAQGKWGGLSTTAATTNSNVVTVNDVSGLVEGHTLVGTTVPTGTTITAIDTVNKRITLDSAITLASGSTLRSYAPGVLEFGQNMVDGTAGSTTEWIRGIGVQGTGRGSVDVDPSLTLKLSNRAYMNMTDNYDNTTTGVGYQNWTFKNVISNASQGELNTLSNIAIIAGDPFVRFHSGYTNITSGSEITVRSGVNSHTARVLAVFNSNIQLDRAPTFSSNVITGGTATTYGGSVDIRQYTGIRMETGKASITAGHNGADDYLDSQMSFSGTPADNTSGVESTFVKVGTNTLTLAGFQDNTAFRLKVEQGTIVLAKHSNQMVHAAATRLTIGDADAAREVIRLGDSGTHDSAGVVAFARYNDQIYGSAHVIVNRTGFLDLNGFTEGIGTLSGETLTLGGVVGNSNSQAATLILGERSGTTSTTTGLFLHWSGNIRDGGWNAAGDAVTGGIVNVIKSGGINQTFTASNDYSGMTLVGQNQLILGDMGVLKNTSRVRIAQAGTLLLSNSGTVVADRVNNAAPVDLRQGVLTMQANATAATSETFGTVKSSLYNILRLQRDNANLTRSNVNTMNLTGMIYDVGSQVAFVENNGTTGISSGNKYGWDATNGATGRGLAAAYRAGWVIYGGGRSNNGTGDDQYAGNLIKSAADAVSRFTITNIPNAALVGGAVLNNASRTNYTYAYNRKDIPLLLGAFGGHYANHTREFMTVETIEGVNYIRPLEQREYHSLAGGVHSSETALGDRKNVLALHTNNTFANANMAFNSMRLAGATRFEVSADKVFKIGDGLSMRGYNPDGHAGAGMLVVNDWGSHVGGQGTLDFGSRAITVRSPAHISIALNMTSTNNIANADGKVVGFSRTGSNHLDLYGRGLYEGETHLLQGSTRVFNSQALGFGGAGNDIRIFGSSSYEESNLHLSRGVTLGSAVNPALKKNIILEWDGRLASVDQNNVVTGNVLHASYTEGGLGAYPLLNIGRNSGILTVKGTTGSTNNQVSGSLVEYITENPAIERNGHNSLMWFRTAAKSSAIINLEGGLADKIIDGVARSAIYDSEKGYFLVRATSGDTFNQTPISDFHVFLGDSPYASGIIDIRGSGWLRMMGNYSTAPMRPFGQGPEQESVAHQFIMRMYNGDSNTISKPNQLGVLAMSNPGGSKAQFQAGYNFSDAGSTKFNVSSITWGENVNAYSSTSYGILANEGRGKTIIGNYYGQLDTNGNPSISFGSSSQYQYYSQPIVNEDGEEVPGAPLPSFSNTQFITLTGGQYVGGSLSDLKPGMILEGGTLIPAGTVINTVMVVNNVATIQLSANVTVNNGDIIEFKSPQTILLSTGSRISDNTKRLHFGAGQVLPDGMNFQNLRPGMGVTGTGVPNNTFIVEVYAPGERSGMPNGGVLLNNGLTQDSLSQLIFNDLIPGSVNTNRFADVRTYAAQYGELDLRLRITDEAGWGLTDEAAAISKLGRGDVRLSGSHTAAGEVDAGVALHGGRLILDYTKIEGRKLSTGDNFQAPITLAGGEMWMIGNATTPPAGGEFSNVNTIEQVRGLLLIRPGASAFRVTSAGLASTRLDLGLPNSFGDAGVGKPLVYSGGTLNFWEDNAGGGAAVITLNMPSYMHTNPIPYMLYGDENGRMTSFAEIAGQGPNDFKHIQSSNSSDRFAMTDKDYRWEELADEFFYENFYREAGITEGTYQMNNIEYSAHLEGILPEGGATRNVIFNMPSDGVKAHVTTVESTFFLVSDESIFKSTAQALKPDVPLHGEPQGVQGGAMLITHEIGSTNKVFRGDIPSSAISGAFITRRYVADFNKPEPFEYNLLIHNHANPYDFQNPNAEGTGGLLVFDLDIVDPSRSPSKTILHWRGNNLEEREAIFENYAMNFVHGGTGTTMMYRARANGAGYGYTGSTFFNGGAIYSKSTSMLAQPSERQFNDLAEWTPGTVWVSDPNKLGANPTSFNQENLYFNGGRLKVDNMYRLNENGLIDHATKESDISSALIVLNQNRGIMIGGQGAWIDVTQAGTLLRINSVIATEPHVPVMGQGTSRKSNVGIGDLTKEGAGTLLLSNPANTYSGVTEILGGTLRIHIGDSVAGSATYNPAINRAQDNFIKNNQGHLGSNYSHIDGTQVKEGGALRFEITGNTANDALGNRFQNGSAEWITLDGGTLGTTDNHIGGSLEGVIRVRKDSRIDVVKAGQVLRLNSQEGMLMTEIFEGGAVGNLTKAGKGTLELWENNASFKGSWSVLEGRVQGVSQGTPLGIGEAILIGDSAATAGSAGAEVLIGSRRRHKFTLSDLNISGTTAATTSGVSLGSGNTGELEIGQLVTLSGPGLGNFTVRAMTETSFNISANQNAVYQNRTGTFTQVYEVPLEYEVHQNIFVQGNPLGVTQRKVIGVANSQTMESTGSNWDRYNYTGDITLGSDLHVAYVDNIASEALARGIANEGRFNDGRTLAWNQTVALNGGLSGSGALRTEVNIVGTSTAADDADVRVYFEMNGQNLGWTGALHTGSGSTLNADNDVLSIIRFGTMDKALRTALATDHNNEVFMSSNSILQAGGKDVTIGTLRVGTLAPGEGIEAFQKLTVAPGSGATDAAQRQTIVIENASDVAGKFTIYNEEDTDWDVLFRDGVTSPNHITNVNNITGATRNAALSLVKHGGYLFGPDADWSGDYKGTAVLTQNNTYTGVTEVLQGNLQVGAGNTAETGQLGRTGLGQTIVYAGAAISGTGLVQKTVTGTTTHVLEGILRPGDNAGKARGTLTFDGNLAAQGASSNISLNAGTATRSAADLHEANVSLGELATNNTVAMEAAMVKIANTWGNTNMKNAGDHDHVQVNGTFTMTGETTVQVIHEDNVTYYHGDVYNFLDWTSVNANDFNTGGELTQGGSISAQSTVDLLLPLLTGDLWWNTSRFLTHGMLVIVAVPEPSKGFLIVVAVGAMLMRRRR